MKRTLAGALVAVAFAISLSTPAWAGQGIGQGYGSVNRHRVTATATYRRSGSSIHPAPTTTTISPESTSPTTATTLPPTAPYCTYVVATPAESAALGIGGAMPGYWEFAKCFNEGTTDPQPPVWVTEPTPTPTPTTTPTAQPSVPAVATQALGQAALVDPTIVLNPVGPQVVNFASWMAISPNDWHTITASATENGVAVTVKATPTAVLWTMGNGASLSCSGPGVLYNSAEPASAQSTYCSYTWAAPSFDQPNHAYDVTATIQYQVTTAVNGAANTTPDLGAHLGPTAHAAVEVTEVEALGTSS